MSYIEQFWRDATAADVARLVNGETVEARFRDADLDEWVTPYALCGWYVGILNWLDENGSGWTYCQVYEPEQWWLDKPDPGEGYRLLGKLPDEDLQVDDDAFWPCDEKWHRHKEGSGKQISDMWYRRKIEQPKPEPKFAVGQRVRIVGPKERLGAIWERAMDQYIGHDGTLTSLDYVSGRWFCQIADEIVWSFHEDYLEAVVEPEPKHYVLRVGDTAEIPKWIRFKVTEDGIEVQ